MAGPLALTAIPICAGVGGAGGPQMRDRFDPFRTAFPNFACSGHGLAWPYVTLCCTGRDRGRTGPYPVRGQAVRTYFGRPSSSMRFITWTATSISVARRSSVRERSPSPITRLNRPMVASARARAL